MKLLLVEDSIEFGDLIHKMLKQEPFIDELVWATTAASAVRDLGENQFDVVLTDYDLGYGRNGLDVVYFAKWEANTIPPPRTILWSFIMRDHEVSRTPEEDRPDHVLTKNQIDDMLSILRSVNDEINEKVVH